MSEAICTKCQYLGDAAPCDECYFKGNGHSAFTPPAPPTKTGEIKLPVRYDAERAMVYDAGGGLLLNNLFTPDLACEREYEEWKAEKDRFGQAIADALNTRTAEREALAQLLTATRAYFHADEDDGSVIDPMLRALTEAERVLAAHQEGRENE